MLTQLIPQMKMQADEGTTLTGAEDTGEVVTSTPVDDSPTFQGTWYEGTSQEIYDDPSLSAFKGEDGSINGQNLLKSYVHAQKNIGADKVVIPGENATDEDRRAFYHKMGLPDKIEDYQLLKEGEKSNSPELFQAFKQKAYELGIMPAQAKELVKFFDGQTQQMYETQQQAQEQQQEQAMSELKQAWGDKFDANIEMAQMAVKEFADESFVEFLDSTGMGNHPKMIEMFAQIGQAMGDDSMETGAGETVPGGTSKYTPEEAQTKINEIMSDLEGPYYNTDHPNHQTVVNEVNKLFAMTA